MFLPNFHPAGDGGKAFELTPVLKPLEPLREHVNVISGLSTLGVISTNEGGGVHTRAHAGWLNGVLPKRTEGADITATDAVVVTTAILKAVNVQLFELGMWQAWSGR